ncbi:hypothetical protein SERLA73DRAFT_70232 [Serpula lacrymans var. lacrymans S7.3]|uniref:Carbohydrate-binding module family 19 domain-containing protein n=1 Tax=Serpula lacrymans var. lacrymans (strain S7.3) TaxID=936435 RepID=F8PMB9_SERL3|nr:hypothetical protein SERLA73DRAFT_70232 [Serpula lacrymans var. lacrymans S7.3]
MKFFTLAAFAFAPMFVNAIPTRRASSSGFLLQNGVDAINQNNQFKSLTTSSSCTAGENACVNNEFAQCVSGKFVLTACSSSLICAALPLVNSAGTSIACTTQSDVDSRIAATGATSGSSGTTGSTTSVSTSTATSVSAASPTSTSGSSGNGQSSLTLLSSVIAKGFAQNGQGLNTSESGEVASLTSTNNFINFCATVPDQPLTNGQQIKGGSCNPATMGSIPSTANMPSAKFVSPVNMDTIPANTSFTVSLAISGISTGFFTNADSNYFAAPQQLDSNGQIKGHSHIVIEALSSIQQTTPTNPTKFAFFLGLNSKADSKGQLYANVTGGLPEGAYKMSTINTAMNHQPALVAVAQHGSLDDAVYFTVVASGTKTNGTTKAVASS